SSGSVVPIQPKGTKPPFFCLPGLGEGVLNFGLLSKHLGTDRPFYGLQPRELTGGEMQRTIEDMATHHIQEMRKVQPKGPYYIGGYCFGGTVAFEMANQLHA